MLWVFHVGCSQRLDFADISAGSVLKTFRENSSKVSLIPDGIHHFVKRKREDSFVAL